MKAYSTKNIRNVVLLGSTKSGKTTLSEAMLYEGKVIDRRGTVEGKNTVSDNSEIEQMNQRSIYATPLYAEFKDTKFNIVDTPGADDFVGGAVSAFKVCDLGILVVNAQQGVEVGTQIFSRYASEYKVPLIAAVNQLDGEKASWETTIEAMKEAFGGKPKSGDLWRFMVIRNACKGSKFSSCGWPVNAHRDFSSAAKLVFK